MPPTSRDAIQEGLASKDAKRSKMSHSNAELNKFTMKERASAGCANTVHMQGYRKNLISLFFAQNWLNKQKPAQYYKINNSERAVQLLMPNALFIAPSHTPVFI